MGKRTSALWDIEKEKLQELLDNSYSISGALRKLKLTSDDWFADAEIIIQASYLGFSIKEIPTIFHVNDQRPSFIKFKAIFEFIKNLIKYRIKNKHILKQ